MSSHSGNDDSLDVDRCSLGPTNGGSSTGGSSAGGSSAGGSSAGEPSSVDEFFDRLTAEYAAAIELCFPRYREMLWALLDYLPVAMPVNHILELGCGTGNLSVLLAERYPEARLDLVDVSSESLDVCRSRLGDDSRFRFLPVDFRQLNEDEPSCDLIVSSIAIHHLTAIEKRNLFGSLFRLLRPGGTFAYADQHAGATEELSRRHQKHWHDQSIEAGSSEAQWQMWMKHQADHDHHDTVVDQIDWLREAGFRSLDCPWRYLLWTVLQAKKPPSTTPSKAF